MAGGSQSGYYLNEADPNEPSWQQKFFGTQATYNRLRSIKDSVDAHGLFVCKNCVGSEDWSSDLNCPTTSNGVKFKTKKLFLAMIILVFLSDI